MKTWEEKEKEGSYKKLMKLKTLLLCWKKLSLKPPNIRCLEKVFLSFGKSETFRKWNLQLDGNNENSLVSET